MKHINYKIAHNNEELNQVLALQHANHFSHLTALQKAEQGFVTVRHNLAQLQDMRDLLPQFIATHVDRVVGYVLSMNFQMKDTVASLTSLFEELDQFSYNGLALSRQPFVICGQTCIHPDFRGQGIMQELYRNMFRELNASYEGCITEISDLNQRSLNAHAKIGFETIHRYNDGQQDWHIVLCKWEVAK